MEKKKCALLVTGGSVDLAFASDFIKEKAYGMVIAVDGGLKLCHELGLPPTHLVGDFDTADPELVETYRAVPGMAFFRHSPEKDATDTELALSLALEAGWREIHILAATGTRLDHSLANIQLLKQALEAGAFCTIFDSHNQAYLLGGEGEGNYKHVIRRRGQFGDYVSLLPLAGKVFGVTLSGFQYGLDNQTMEVGSSLGISNRIVAEEGVISFSQGLLLVVEAKD